MFICTICEKCQPCKGTYPIGIHSKLICKACMTKLSKYITPVEAKLCKSNKVIKK